MNVMIYTSSFTLALLGILWGLPGCTPGLACHEPLGRWSSHEGQEFIFQSDGRAYWLIRFGSSIDTMVFDYKFDCSERPATLDLRNFKMGPYAGKALFAILEWSSDTSFRLRYEVGQDASDRPEAFDSDQTLLFFKEKSL